VIFLILIDDAGSGSLIGGTIIGAMRSETKEFVYDIIPLKYYSPQFFCKKLYLDCVVEIVEDLLKKLKASDEEQIFVCRGYMFDNFRKWISNTNFKCTSTKIEEPLQSKIESAFEDYTISLGFPKRFISYTKYPFHFHRILCWIYADYDKRVSLCKTGWKSFEKYGLLQTQVTYDKLKKSHYICLKCDKRIEDNSQVKIIEFTSNRPQKIYLHHDC
jgi:hypothetical protein